MNRDDILTFVGLLVLAIIVFALIGGSINGLLDLAIQRNLP